MTIDIVRIDASQTHLLERIAPEVFDEPVRPDRLGAYLKQGNHMLLLALDWEDVDEAGRPLVVAQCAAVLHLHPDKETELYVDELGTALGYRRRGIGRDLMLAIFQWGRELGCEVSWLGTEVDNVEANALYEKLPDVKISSAIIYEYDIQG